METKADLFKPAYFAKVRKGDIVFRLEDQDDCQFILKKTRKILKAENLSTGRTSWITKMKFDLKGYCYLEK